MEVNAWGCAHRGVRADVHVQGCAYGGNLTGWGGEP